MTPAIRFKGFNNDWEQRKLEELAGRYDNLRIPVTASDRIPGNTPYYGANGIQDYVEGFTHDGEFVLIAEDGANDLNDYPVHYVNGKVWVNNHAHVIQAIKDTSDNKFLKYSFKTLNIEPYLVGGSRAKLNANIMMNLIINTPKLEEQKKIGSFFSQLHNLITLHQRKHDKLIFLKKSMLEKMFPQKGEKIPEVRFSGFNNDWEQRKLGEFGKATGGTSIESEFVDNGSHKVISIGSYSEDSKYTDQGIRVNETRKTIDRILDKDDITMILNDKTASGNIIGRVLLIDTDNTYVYNQRTQRIEVNKEEYIPMFLYHYLNADNIRSKIIKASQGNTQIYVNWSVISELQYLIPNSSEEQTQIGTFFQQLDNLITLHQRKVEKLKIVKKSMLEKMFV